MPQNAASVVAAFVRTVFTQPDEPSARAQLRAVAERLATSFPTAAGALLAPEDDVLADLACPREHWTTIWSTNQLEWHNRELARRNDVIGIVLNRLGTTLLVEQDDEWLTMAKHCLPKSSVTRLLSGVPGTTLAELLKEAMAVGEVIRLEAHLHHLTGHGPRGIHYTQCRRPSGTQEGVLAMSRRLDGLLLSIGLVMSASSVSAAGLPDDPAPLLANAAADCSVGRSTVDRSDDAPGFQVHAGYIVPPGEVDRSLDTDGSIARTVSAANEWMASQTGGQRFRLDTCGGQLDVSYATLPKPTSDYCWLSCTFDSEFAYREIARQFNDPYKVYLWFYEGAPWGNNVCGVGTYNSASIWLASGCNPVSSMGASMGPGTATRLVTHELVHVLGFVDLNSSKRCAANLSNGHVSDDPNDLMYGGDGPRLPSDPNRGIVLDAAHDDYYGTTTSDCLDLSRSVFLEPTAANPELPREAVSAPSAPALVTVVPSSVTTSPSVRETVTWKGGSTDWTGTFVLPEAYRALVYDLELSTDGGAFVPVYAGATASYAMNVKAGHRYQYRVRARNGGNWLVSTWSVGRVFSVTKTDSAATAVRYVGRWTTTRHTSDIGGSVRSASVKGASASFAFSGDRIAWIARKGPSNGSANVYIDGKLVKTVSLYAARSAARRTVFLSARLANGRHTIKVVAVGTDRHPTVDVDAFIVAG